MTTKKTLKLTPALLQSLIEEEVKKGFGEMEDTEKKAKDTDEVEADEYADTLDHPVDFKKAVGVKEGTTLDGHINLMKAYKLEEARLSKIVVQGQKASARLARVREALQRSAKNLVIAKVVA
jgi:hypothetical protein